MLIRLKQNGPVAYARVLFALNPNQNVVTSHVRQREDGLPWDGHQPILQLWTQRLCVISKLVSRRVLEIT